MWFNRKLEKENQQLRETMLLKEQQHQSELAELRATIGEYEHMQRTSRERGDLFNQVISCQNQGGEMLQSVREALAGSAEHLMAEKGALCELDQLFAQTRGAITRLSNRAHAITDEAARSRPSARCQHIRHQPVRDRHPGHFGSDQPAGTQCGHRGGQGR
ncbi:hypothetical protein ACK3ZP_09385 [Aeromonas caviae]